ncbi:hypothetical protein PFICI_00851 [Pestalotiopsis fici W106-1]|uniref:Uncharacterized protein n=1 Tax=Pestalotiopsis fici (strain W106-1 / CGMCC3.15140) TaxID=1229662 RepID=W3XLT4_PESFW|nr:uncharacterized protein PFICI_00851 [Pestalotiopsis fici W106-1]ETS87023.1 hypothetical protein PFICI_00851 [Pestalotiopsis fici W106-1]
MNHDQGICQEGHIVQPSLGTKVPVSGHDEDHDVESIMAQPGSGMGGDDHEMVDADEALEMPAPRQPSELPQILSVPSLHDDTPSVDHAVIKPNEFAPDKPGMETEARSNKVKKTCQEILLPNDTFKSQVADPPENAPRYTTEQKGKQRAKPPPEVQPHDDEYSWLYAEFRLLTFPRSWAICEHCHMTIASSSKFNDILMSCRPRPYAIRVGLDELVYPKYFTGLNTILFFDQSGRRVEYDRLLAEFGASLLEVLCEPNIIVECAEF